MMNIMLSRFDREIIGQKFVKLKKKSALNFARVLFFDGK